ncbi:hypothetical protein FRB91_005622 [Serendipita sp. 411]|nr:hypothetical protein FRB91_005622 [Serendipita sp. 411]
MLPYPQPDTSYDAQASFWLAGTSSLTFVAQDVHTNRVTGLKVHLITDRSSVFYHYNHKNDRERDNRRDCAPAKLCRHCDSNDFFQRQFDGLPQYKTPNLALLVEAPEVPAFRHYHLDNLYGGVLSEPIEKLDVAAKLLREIAEISDTLGVLKGISGVISRITTAIVTIEQNSEGWKELGNVLQAQEKLLKDQFTRLEWDDTEYHKTCPLRAPFQEY